MRSEEKLEYLGEFDIIFEMNFRVWGLLLEKKTRGRKYRAKVHLLPFTVQQ
jgi:hypothetical protein